MKRAEDWIRFLRKYGPIARNGNMFDEDIMRTSIRAGIAPVTFKHPLTERLISCFDPFSESLKSVILTGAAGDGKTHLCRQVWEKIGGAREVWASDEPYVQTSIQHSHKGQIRIHVIRDLSAWVPQQGMEWPVAKEALILKFCNLLFKDETNELFLIAANDGQLIETWRRLDDHTEAIKVSELFEKLLVEDKEEEPDVRLKFFNLSKISSAELFKQALKAIISHERWKDCFEGENGESITFGRQSPIRKNYELLCDPLVQERLKVLFELCDYNNLHVPIREILLLLANAILGHPDCGGRLMIPNDVARVINSGSESKASLYNNIFGGNLSVIAQDSIPVFNYLNLFRIGYETNNRIDNLLIYGEEDEQLQPVFAQLVGSDSFYGATEAYRSAKRTYIEGADEDSESYKTFLKQLVAQRRALFFKIPHDQEDELGLWELVIFRYAGEFKKRVFHALKAGHKVERRILSRLVKGLNRIWVGMLVDSDRELYLATGLSFSNARVSRILAEQISVNPRLGQKVDIILKDNKPVLLIALSRNIICTFQLSLIRYEFLSRVADGALPNSFSKECYEDAMSFKSQALAALSRRREEDEDEQDEDLVFRLLRIDEHGNPMEESVEALDV
ncbi:hypothetical protein ACFL0O_04220 [Thermodesulfobacteriota bacterium]